MELKDILNEELKTKTKLKIMEEYGISYRTLQKALDGGTIRKDIYDKIMERSSGIKTLRDFVDEKINNSVFIETKRKHCVCNSC